MSDKYPRVSQTQVDLWLVDAVTKNFLIALDCYKDKVKESTDNGEGFDMSNNDFTCNTLHFREGMKEGFRIAGEPEGLLNHYELIEKEDSEDGDA